MAATKVLVVDDDLNIQRVLVFTLKQEGFEVHVASDGQAGVEMAAAIEPDLILMDVAMPSMDGVTAARHIRGESDGADVPIVFLTALGTTGDRASALAAGGNDYLLKPIGSRELLRVVEQWVGGSAGGARSAG